MNEQEMMMSSMTRSPTNGAFTHSETNNTDPKASFLVRKKLSQASTNMLVTQKSHLVKSKPSNKIVTDSIPFEYAQLELPQTVKSNSNITLTVKERGETIPSAMGRNTSFQKNTHSLLEQRLSNKLIDAEMAMGHRYGEFNNTVRKGTGSVIITPSMSKQVSGVEMQDHATLSGTIGSSVEFATARDTKKSLL